MGKNDKRSTWGDKPIKDMTQKEFEAKHREDLQRQRDTQSKRGGW